MRREELQQICNTYKKSIIEKDADKYLMMMAEDIERVMRQECTSMAFDLAYNIANMHPRQIGIKTIKARG